MRTNDKALKQASGFRAISKNDYARSRTVPFSQNLAQERSILLIVSNMSPRCCEGGGMTVPCQRLHITQIADRIHCFVTNKKEHHSQVLLIEVLKPWRTSLALYGTSPTGRPEFRVSVIALYIRELRVFARKEVRFSSQMRIKAAIVAAGQLTSLWQDVSL